MQEKDQQVLTATVIRELAIDPRTLWLHYVSIGGNLDLDPVLDYIAGSRTLPVLERNRVTCAVNDLRLEPPWRPRAPYADDDPE